MLSNCCADPNAMVFAGVAERAVATKEVKQCRTTASSRPPLLCRTSGRVLAIGRSAPSLCAEFSPSLRCHRIANLDVDSSPWVDHGYTLTPTRRVNLKAAPKMPKATKGTMRPRLGCGYLSKSPLLTFHVGCRTNVSSEGTGSSRRDHYACPG